MADSRLPEHSTGYRPDIDGLRAVSVMAVLLFHAGFDWIGGGFVGVDVFFVISGYLIARLLLKDVDAGALSLGRFYERRIRRIFPALAVTVSFTVIAASLLFLPNEFALFGKSLAAAALSVSNVEFWREANYFDLSSAVKPLLHTWSLGVEEQFYLFFPFCLIFIHRYLGRRYCFWSVIGWVLSFLLGAVLIHFEKQIATFYLLPTRAWELLTGVILATYSPRVAASFARCTVLGGIGLTGMVVSMLFLHAGDKNLPVLLVFPVLSAAMVMYAGQMRSDTFASRFLAWRPMVFTGKISYSLYLWHWPLLVFVRYYVIRPLDNWEIAGVLVAAYGLAVLSWKFIELPFRSQNFTWQRRHIIATFALFNAVFLIFGVVGVRTHGLPQRFSPDILALTHAEKGGAGKHSDFNTGTQGTLGDENEKNMSFVLWGDSHANALSPMIDAQAKTHHRRGLMLKKPGCLSTTDFTVPQSSDCIRFNKEVLGWLSEHPSVRTVILVSRWSAYARWWHDTRSLTPEDELRAEFKRAVIKLVHDLRTRGYRVVLMAEPPQVDYDVPSVLARLALYERTLEIRPDVLKYKTDQASNFGIFEELKKNEHIQLVYPATILCDDTRCAVAAPDGQSLYFDGNHLSTVGAERIAPLFDPYFK